MEYLNSLNEKQKEAVLYTDGPLLIVAGAGAGKTKTITHRIIHLIHEGVHPSNILAVPLPTKPQKKCAIEFEALEDPIHGIPHTPQSELPFVSTFHALGVYIIKEHASLIGLTKHFSIADEHDALVIIKDAMKARDIDPKQYEPRKIKSIISRSKGDFISIDTYTNNANSALASIVAVLWRDYDRALKAEKMLDFDDLLLETVMILKNTQKSNTHTKNGLNIFILMNIKIPTKCNTN